MIKHHAFSEASDVYYDEPYDDRVGIVVITNEETLVFIYDKRDKCWKALRSTFVNIDSLR